MIITIIRHLLIFYDFTRSLLILFWEGGTIHDTVVVIEVVVGAQNTILRLDITPVSLLSIIFISMFFPLHFAFLLTDQHVSNLDLNIICLNLTLPP